MNMKLNKRDIYYGCDSYDFVERNCPKFRLQKLNDGYYFRWIRKEMFYWASELEDTAHIFNVTKLKLSGKRRYKNK